MLAFKKKQLTLGGPGASYFLPKPFKLVFLEQTFFSHYTVLGITLPICSNGIFLPSYLSGGYMCMALPCEYSFLYCCDTYTCIPYAIYTESMLYNRNNFVIFNIAHQLGKNRTLQFTGFYCYVSSVLYTIRWWII